MGKILTFILIIAGVALFLFAFQSFSPVKITDLFGDKSSSSPFSESACLRVVTIKGGSMEPTFKDGQTTTFNKCIDTQKESLKVGTIVLLEKSFEPIEIMVIRKRTGTGVNTIYTVSNNQSSSSTKEVPASEIKAIYKK